MRFRPLERAVAPLNEIAAGDKQRQRTLAVITPLPAPT